ncbi:helix-turn-helix domain-containing protein [Phyllobacterium myrsinacearum]|nr:helix-turn-helix domain-containing protein [Phyllobacterium myrsinacearum]
MMNDFKDRESEASATENASSGLERRRWPRQPAAQDRLNSFEPPALKPLHFSTFQLPPEDQFDAWKEYVSGVVDVRIPDQQSTSAGFLAEHTAWNLGGMLIAKQRVPGHSYARSETRHRTSSIDHWVIAIMRSGRSWTEMNGAVVENEPGKAVIRSLGFPFRGRATDAESLQLYLPRDVFAETFSGHNIRNNSLLSGNLTSLLVEYVVALEGLLPTLRTDELPGVVRIVQSMVTTCLLALTGQEPVSNRLLGAALIERARHHIQINLYSEDLSPETLSRALGISRTHLYQLFEPSGGVLHYIQKRRLLSAHAALSDPANNQQISDIGQTVGFSSAANFSRAFSKEFGYSPSAARSAASSQVPVASSSHWDKQEGTFGDWLKALGT